MSRLLEAAMVLGHEIEIIYHGGSRPGAPRHIIPLSLRGDALRAMAGGAVKSFKLSLVELPPDGPFHVYGGLHDILLHEQALIIDSGLDLEADRFHLALSMDGRQVLFIRRSGWVVNGHGFPGPQEAAEVFVTALRLLRRSP